MNKDILSKNTFILYSTWLKPILSLSMEQRGLLFTAIYYYETKGEAPKIEDPAVSMLFNVMQERFDADAAKYAEEIRRKSEGGRKGNEKRWKKVHESEDRPP